MLKQGGDVYMRRPNPIRALVGGLMLAAGLLILFARVLPPGFWWFCVGASLTAGGLCLLTRR